MTVTGTPSRRRILTTAFSAALAIAGCLGPEPDPNTYLSFRNPELTDGFDALRVLGINARKHDTLVILQWLKGEEFPSKTAYPPGLEPAFTLLVRGFKGDALVYESRTQVDGGQAHAKSQTLRMTAPALPDLPDFRTARIGDSITLDPVWETRPGIFKRADSGDAEVFTPNAEFAWSREGKTLSSEGALHIDSLTMEDSGSYTFLAENPEGKDSLVFRLKIRHAVPMIGKINPQAALIGKPLKVIPVISHSDSLHFRWMKNGITVATDSVLAFTALRAQDTGDYQLKVANASDSLDFATSNQFAVDLAPDPNDVWQAEKPLSLGAQAVPNRGSVMDLDIPKAMLYEEAEANQGAIDLLYMYSGAALRLMSPVAAKSASDLTYADTFSDSQIKDVKYVKVTAKPATPSAGRALYEKGPLVNNLGVTGGQSFLVKTTGGKLVWLKVVSYTGTGSLATAEMSAAVGPY